VAVWPFATSSGDSIITACSFGHDTGWGPPVVLQDQPSVALQDQAIDVNLYVDSDDAITAAWEDSTSTSIGIRRNQAGGTWETLPGPPGSAGGLLAGGHGRMAAVGIQAPGKQMNGTPAAIYDPATGWGTPVGLTEPVSIALWTPVPYDDVSATIASDGTVVASFGGDYGTNTGQPSVYAYQTYSAPGGWSTRSLWDECLSAALVPDIDGSIFAFCDTDARHTGNDRSITTRRFDQGSWTAGPTFTAMDVQKSAKVVRNGHFMVVWSEFVPKLRAVYGSAQSAQSIDLDTEYIIREKPYVGMDAEGRAVVAWTAWADSPNGVGSPDIHRWPHQRVLYARFSPDTGWTQPVAIDGDDGFSHGSVLGDLAVNDAGTAMAVWVENGFTTIWGTDAILWAAPLP
jgi:hypothetical protein